MTGIEGKRVKIVTASSNSHWPENALEGSTHSTIAHALRIEQYLFTKAMAAV